MRIRSHIVAVGLWTGCVVTGWVSRPDAAPTTTPVVADARPAAAMSSVPAAPALPTHAASGSAAEKPVLYPHMILTAEEKEILSMTPEQGIAKGDAMGAAEQHLARCRELLPTPGICEKADVTMHHLRLADLANMREFLSGTMEPKEFQEQHHKNMIAWQMELESYLTPEQLEQYPGLESGDDAFLVVTAWGVGAPPGFTMGEDILMRQQGEDGEVNTPDNSRNPWTYAKKVSHGETP